jgi:hypothetical protein
MSNDKQLIETTQIPKIKKAQTFREEIEQITQSLDQKVQTVLDKYPML